MVVSSTLRVEEATCPGIDDPSRKRKDPTGDGKTWRIGSYHHTDDVDYDDVDSLSCGPFTYYDIQHNYGNPPTGMSDYGNAVEKPDDETAVTDSDMRILSTTKDYIQGGYTNNVQPTQKVGNVTLTGGHLSSSEAWREDRNNWTRACSKNNSGYGLTNPYDGKPIGNTVSVEGSRYNTNTRAKKHKFHKTACCGFLSTASAGEPEYCHTSYCNIGDIVTSRCRNHLADLCENPTFFAKSPYCKLPSDAYAAGGGGADLSSDITRHIAGTYSLSLKTNDYKRIGKEICVKDSEGNSPFEPLGEEPGLDDAGYDEYVRKLNLRNSCVTWCGRNPGECREEITDFCEGVYDEAVANNGIGGKRFIDSQRVCGCNFPPKYYTDLRKNYSENFGVPMDKLSATPYCINYSCKTSEIGDTRNSGRGGIYDDNQGECGSVNILNCVQEIDFNADEINVMDGGTFTFSPQQSSDCNLTVEQYNDMKNYYEDNVTGTSSSSSSSSSSKTKVDDDDNTIMYLGIFFILCFSLCFLLIMVMFMFDDDDSGSSGSSRNSRNSRSSDINTQLDNELN